MKKFNIFPENAIKESFVIDSSNLAEWRNTFIRIMRNDFFAPVLIVMGDLALALDAKVPRLATPGAERYAWLGEMIADADREEIGFAAYQVGLLQAGLNGFLCIATSSPDLFLSYREAVAEIMNSKNFDGEIPAYIVSRCLTMLESVEEQTV